MSLSADLSPPRRPLFFPVVIATVFLAIIGISAGFALGTEHRRARDSEAAPVPATETTSDSLPPPPAPEGIACPEKMQETAQRLGITDTLTQVFRVRTQDTGLTVWICQDSATKLYYQANRGGEDAKWVEGETALFLTEVERSGGSFIATAKDGATFTVGGDDLHIVKKDGAVEDHPVQVE